MFHIAAALTSIQLIAFMAASILPSMVQLLSMANYAVSHDISAEEELDCCE